MQWMMFDAKWYLCITFFNIKKNTFYSTTVQLILLRHTVHFDYVNFFAKAWVINLQICPILRKGIWPTKNRLNKSNWNFTTLSQLNFSFNVAINRRFQITFAVPIENKEESLIFGLSFTFHYFIFIDYFWNWSVNSFQSLISPSFKFWLYIEKSSVYFVQF
jgi:hypothetical protein